MWHYTPKTFETTNQGTGATAGPFSTILIDRPNVQATWMSLWAQPIDSYPFPPYTVPPTVQRAPLYTNPRAYPPGQSYTFNNMLEMLQQPASFHNNYDQPNPRGNPRPDEFYSFSNLLQITQQPASLFNQYDWPNPRPYPPGQSYTFTNLTQITQQPASFLENYDWPNPPRVTWYKSTEFTNILELVQQPASYLRNYDFPNPQPVQWYKSWEFSNLRFISQQPASYFQNYDQPNPRTYPRLDQFWTQDLLQTTLAVVQATPFNQFDWPNPLRTNWYQDWNQNLGLYTLFQSLAIFMPFQGEWALPPSPQTMGLTWTQSLLQSTLAPTVGNPFVQTDWPLPKGNPRPDEYYTFSNIQTVLQQPVSILNNFDWPNPPRITWYKDWEQGIPFGALQTPFNQTDWPNPRTWTPIQQAWYQNLIYILTQANPQPFVQSDWPLTKAPQPIDPTWLQALVLNLPEPPPPPPGPISGGRQVAEWEVEQYLVAANEYYKRWAEANVMDVNIHSLGGKARAKSLTSQQRTNIATKAAQTRWQSPRK